MAPTRGDIDSNSSQVGCTSGYRVFVRVRPMSGIELGEDRQVVEVLNQTRLRVAQPYRAPTELKVDRVLAPEEGQEDLFNTVADVVSGVVQGRSGTILAYGQTGSGKTYMMVGPPCSEGEFAGQPLLVGEQRGLIPRALESLFATLSEETEERRVRISFMEIYNEQVYDLLDSSGNAKGLELREARNSPVEVPGLQTFEVYSLDEALELLEEGTANRAWGNNGFNATSSRSHALFQVQVDDAIGNSAKLSLVDLAGSEKLQPGHGAMNTETTRINLSLTALGQCIAALLDVKRKHVPYRNSKLTRLLQEPLQNPSSATVMCVCISPSYASLSETMSSLQFADRAKRVVVQRREPPASTSNGSARVEELVAQLQKVNAELVRERGERLRLEGLLSRGGGVPEAQCGSSGKLSDPNADSDKGYTMEEGTSTLQLAFEMAKQGLEDIISVVEVLDHDAVAVAKAKQGLQEIVAAVDILHRDALAAMKLEDDQESCPEHTATGALLDQRTTSQAKENSGRISVEELAALYSVEVSEAAACASPWHPVDDGSACDSPWEPVSPKKKHHFILPSSSPRTESTKNSDGISSRRGSNSSESDSSSSSSGKYGQSALSSDRVRPPAAPCWSALEELDEDMRGESRSHGSYANISPTRFDRGRKMHHRGYDS